MAISAKLRWKLVSCVFSSGINEKIDFFQENVMYPCNVPRDQSNQNHTKKLHVP